MNTFFIILIVGILCQQCCHSSPSSSLVKKISESDRNIVTGSTVELVCTLNRLFDSEISWRKLQGRLSDESEEINGKLIIRSLTREDDGEYECSNGSGEKQVIRLTIYNSLNDLEKSNQSKKNKKYMPLVEGHFGGSVEIHCEIRDEPTLVWEKSKGEMSKYKTIYGAPDNRLVLFYLTEEDSGVYICKSSNGRSSSVILKVKAGNDELVNRNNNNDYDLENFQEIQRNAGSFVQFVCDIRHSGNENIKWRKTYGRINENSRIWENKLEINDLKVEDAGIYECFTDKTDSIKFNLIVTPLANKNAEQAVQKEEFQNKELDKENELPQQQTLVDSYIVKGVNLTVELKCAINSANYFDLDWRKLYGEIAYDRATATENKLTITGLLKEDSGIYECSMDNGAVYRISLEVTPNTVNSNKNKTILQQNFQLGDDDFDRSDKSCEEDERVCNNGECIAATAVCDGINHCTDGSDEQNCDNQQPTDDEDEPSINCEEENQRKCNDGKLCVSAFAWCDGVSQCDDGSDELDCPTPDEPEETSTPYEPYEPEETSTPYEPYEPEETSTPYEPYEPEETSTPYEPYEPEETTTPYEPDEPEWPRRCREDEATCRNGQCISRTRLCNGVADCQDGSDEHNCGDRPVRPERPEEPERPRRCREDEATCRNGQCISRTRLCNGVADCQDGSDEHNCGDRPVRPERPYEPEWPQRPEEPEWPQRPEEPERPQRCREDEATCRNGQCISKSRLCNGVADCQDGSDENNCGYSRPGQCQPNEVSCRNNAKCIPKIWVCDGEKECPDGSDEENCGDYSRPGDICKTTEHLCNNRNQCVAKSFLCDNERDCTDGSDEIGCVGPRVTQPPTRQITVGVGESFKIDCRASGFPVPLINWRLNWGHTCEEPRCCVTNENGYGVLIVTDVRYTDAGAYSCEAINSKGREFAIPDAIIEVVPRRTPIGQIYYNCTHIVQPPPIIITTTTTTTRRTTTRTTTPEEIYYPDCRCHNHSDICTCSNICYDCQHNTEGDHCERCKWPYKGDATRGTPFDCYLTETTPRPIIITTTTTRRTTRYIPPVIMEESDCPCYNHTNDCTCSVCLNCQHNTMGNNCEECKPGYVGDATRGTPYDCVLANQDEYLFAPPTVVQKCHPFGTAQIIDNVCTCKPGVVGDQCDQCAPMFFNLLNKKQYKRGCLSCFCNGLNIQCHSSELFYAKESADFEHESNEWFISDRFLDLPKQNFELVDSGIEFNKFEEYSQLDLYILVADKFKGNKLAAFGGNLTFKLTVRDESGVDRSQIKPIEIRLSGSHVNIYHRGENPINLNQENLITVPIFEDQFKRYGDNGKVDRDHLMMALSDIKLIMIRASYTPSQHSLRISDFHLDLATADHSNGESIAAKAVEVCNCPEGYTGNSCENCAPGYERSNRGFYLGLCERK